MKASVARVLRNNHNVDPISRRKPYAEHPPLAPIRESSEAEGPSFEMPLAEEPSSPKKKSRRANSKRGGTQA